MNRSKFVVYFALLGLFTLSTPPGLNSPRGRCFGAVSSPACFLLGAVLPPIAGTVYIAYNTGLFGTLGRLVCSHAALIQEEFKLLVAADEDTEQRNIQRKKQLVSWDSDGEIPSSNELSGIKGVQYAASKYINDINDNFKEAKDRVRGNNTALVSQYVTNKISEAIKYIGWSAPLDNREIRPEVDIFTEQVKTGCGNKLLAAKENIEKRNTELKEYLCGRNYDGFCLQKPWETYRQWEEELEPPMDRHI
ncbi:MAG: hypothetical protein LBB24_02455 [Rickettsiales bacterium]|nr:hypothetical protein [Rickettsiales bacterium]